MKRLGLCSVLLACCLAAPAAAARWDDDVPTPDEPAAAPAVPESEVPFVEQPSPSDYYPAPQSGYIDPLDHGTLATFNVWPRVCTQGLWDNFCNERHCFCYRGANQRYGANGCGLPPCSHHKRCGHPQCQNCSYMFTGHNLRLFTCKCRNQGCQGNCSSCNGGGDSGHNGDSTIVPDAEIEAPAPAPVPEPPAGTSASNNPFRSRTPARPILRTITN